MRALFPWLVLFAGGRLSINTHVIASIKCDTRNLLPISLFPPYDQLRLNSQIIHICCLLYQSIYHAACYPFIVASLGLYPGLWYDRVDTEYGELHC
jgi:hypothetical protein